MFITQLNFMYSVYRLFAYPNVIAGIKVGSLFLVNYVSQALRNYEQRHGLTHGQLP